MSVKGQEDWIEDFLNQSGIYAEPYQGEDLTEVLNRMLARLETLETVMLAEQLQRLENPGLQDAWEKYQVMKRLTNGGKR